METATNMKSNNLITRHHLHLLIRLVECRTKFICKNPCHFNMDVSFPLLRWPPHKHIRAYLHQWYKNIEQYYLLSYTYICLPWNYCSTCIHKSIQYLIECYCNGILFHSPHLLRVILARVFFLFSVLCAVRVFICSREFLSSLAFMIDVLEPPWNRHWNRV